MNMFLHGYSMTPHPFSRKEAHYFEVLPLFWAHLIAILSGKHSYSPAILKMERLEAEVAVSLRP